jgi:hypothetical protein
LVTTIGSAWNLPPVIAAHAKFGLRNCHAQLLQMRQDFGSRFAREKNVELLTAATVGFASASDTPQVGCDHS